VSDVVSEAFPDHHAYTQAEIAAAAERVRREGLAGIVTTEKDAVKIDPSWAGGALILVVEIDLEFRSGREELEALVRERLRRRLERNGSRSTVPTADGVQA
jgi:tetraacyldisaccharide 4'-kinase